MVRLIVDEGGTRRAFRLGDGVLTVGAGVEARLKLTGDGIAEVHAEIEMRGGSALLRPRAGVMPPTVAGVPAAGETPLELGQAIQIGAARLWLEDEAGTTPAPDEPAAPEATGFDSERDQRRQAAIQAAGRRPRRSVVERTRPRVKRGLPSWVIILGTLGVVGLAALLVWKGVQSMEKSTLAVNAVLARAEEYLDSGQREVAEQRLAALEDQKLTEAQRERIRVLRARITETRGDAGVDAHNRVGNQYMNTLLEKYEENHLQGKPEPAQIRLFLERCKYFRERWPSHPDLPWVTRQETRFEGAVDLTSPKTLADIQWEMRGLIKKSPRKYDEAFALLDEFMPRATSLEAEEVAEMRATMITEREEYALDRLQQAKYELERNDDAGKCVWWLVNSVCYLGELEMENDAANRLVRMPELKEHLEGYRDFSPDIFEDLMENDIVRRKARELGVY